jgi:hypothetical protein
MSEEMNKNIMGEEEMQRRLEYILTKEFLTNLVEVARIYGWSGDYIEIEDFIMSLHYYKNIDIKLEDIMPYKSNELL